jgi:hypothetical protein
MKNLGHPGAKDKVLGAQPTITGFTVVRQSWKIIRP